MKLALIATVTAIAISGCAAAPAYIRVGAEPVSIVDLREATRTVKVYAEPPSGAKVLGQVKTVRCHRRIGDVPPTEAMAQEDLLIAAMGKGANGISNMIVIERPALEFNCWNIYEGSATALLIP